MTFPFGSVDVNGACPCVGDATPAFVEAAVFDVVLVGEDPPVAVPELLPPTTAGAEYVVPISNVLFQLSVVISNT
jgi:hypothetical protein